MSETKKRTRLNEQEFDYLKAMLDKEGFKKIAGTFTKITRMTEEHVKEVDESKDFSEYEANHG